MFLTLIFKLGFNNSDNHSVNLFLKCRKANFYNSKSLTILLNCQFKMLFKFVDLKILRSLSVFCCFCFFVFFTLNCISCYMFAFKGHDLLQLFLSTAGCDVRFQQFGQTKLTGTTNFRIIHRVFVFP